LPGQKNQPETQHWRLETGGIYAWEYLRFED
jgi:hypothetical protein